MLRVSYRCLKPCLSLCLFGTPTYRETTTTEVEVRSVENRDSALPRLYTQLLRSSLYDDHCAEIRRRPQPCLRSTDIPRPRPRPQTSRHIARTHSASEQPRSSRLVQYASLCAPLRQFVSLGTAPRLRLFPSEPLRHAPLRFTHLRPPQDSSALPSLRSAFASPTLATPAFASLRMSSPHSTKARHYAALASGIRTLNTNLAETEELYGMLAQQLLYMRQLALTNGSQ